jgi:hypothetical protein
MIGTNDARPNKLVDKGVVQQFCCFKDILFVVVICIVNVDRRNKNLQYQYNESSFGRFRHWHSFLAHVLF